MSKVPRASIRNISAKFICYLLPLSTSYLTNTSNSKSYLSNDVIMFYPDNESCNNKSDNMNNTMCYYIDRNNCTILISDMCGRNVAQMIYYVAHVNRKFLDSKYVVCDILIVDTNCVVDGYDMGRILISACALPNKLLRQVKCYDIIINCIKAIERKMGVNYPKLHIDDDVSYIFPTIFGRLVD